jgi:hypothetical protein
VFHYESARNSPKLYSLENKVHRSHYSGEGESAKPFNESASLNITTDDDSKTNMGKGMSSFALVANRLEVLMVFVLFCYLYSSIDNDM